MKLRSVALCFLLSAGALAERFDVVVIGATPGGIAAAIAAARQGHTVALAEYRTHVGGMSASGLGKSDITKADAIGGLWDEFVGRVREYYKKTYGETSDQFVKCKNGYFYEPSVAEHVFSQMLSEQRGVTLLLRHRLDEVVRTDKKVAAIRVTDRVNGRSRELRGKVFVDATVQSLRHAIPITENGTYKLQVRHACDAEYTLFGEIAINYTIGNSMGRSESHFQRDADKLTASPNPTRGITIITGAYGNIVVYSVTGEVIGSLQSDGSARIDLSGEQAGIYIARLFDTGGVVHSIRIVKSY